ncbi:MAG: hypothetical protein ACI97A_001513 [Planctomycetota bacterium]|jgi:hypothetical protein
MSNQIHTSEFCPLTRALMLVKLCFLVLVGGSLAGCDASTTSMPEKKGQLFNTDDFSQKKIQIIGSPYSTGLDEPFKSESFEFTLEPGKGVEYMFDMKKSAILFYSWSSETNELIVDFHGHPKPEDKEDYPENFWFRYERHGVKENNGKVVAPIAGMHGWYFKNKSRSTAKITLKAAGDYNKSVVIK